MLLKTTNRCGMGCSHCSEGSTVAGEHMTEDTFLRALEFTARVEHLAWDLGLTRMVLLSGGECTEHPRIVEMVETVVKLGMRPLLITNGMWLENRELREALLRPEWPELLVQVTNDPRFYPRAPARVADRRIGYVDALSIFIPLGRGAKKATHGVPLRRGPSSFNLRSFTRSMGGIAEAVLALRARSLLGAAGQCIPSVTHEGWVVAGETRSCFRIGTVDSTNAELTRALLEMGPCNACGLEANLSPEQRGALGLPDLAGAADDAGSVTP